MKKWLVIFLIVLGLFLIFITFKYIYFSSTSGKIIDNSGNPIEGAKVRLSYSCDVACWLCIAGDMEGRNFGYREIVTDSTGRLEFNSLTKFKFNLPFPMYNCKKTLKVYKEGFKTEGAMSLKPKENEKTINLIPEIRNDINQCNVSKWLCSRMSPDCIGDGFVCNEQLEGAFIQENPTLCNEMPSEPLKNTCFEFLAIKKKDLSLCEEIKDTPTNSVEGTRRACRFDVTLEIGDSSLCSKLQNSPWQYKDWCEVYFS